MIRSDWTTGANPADAIASSTSWSWAALSPWRACPFAPGLKRAMVTAHIPMARAGEAEEMAATTAFLLSEDAGYVTGQTIFVDGGLTLFADFRGTWSSE